MEEKYFAKVEQEISYAKSPCFRPIDRIESLTMGSFTNINYSIRYVITLTGLKALSELGYKKRMFQLHNFFNFLLILNPLPCDAESNPGFMYRV